MKKFVLLIVISLASMQINAQLKVQPFKRISYDKDFFQNYKVVKNKVATKIEGIDAKKETINGAFPVSEDTIILQTMEFSHEKINNKKKWVSEKHYYKYNFKNNTLIKVLNNSKIQKYNDIFLNLNKDISYELKNDFKVKTKKEKVKNTLKGVGYFLASGLTNNTDIYSYHYRKTKILNYFNNDTIIFFYKILFKNFTTPQSVYLRFDYKINNDKIISVFQDERTDDKKYSYSTHEVDLPKLKTTLTEKGFDGRLVEDTNPIYASIKGIDLIPSRNSQFIYCEGYLFDILNEKKTAIVSGYYSCACLSYNNDYLIAFSGYKHQYIVDVLPIKKEWVEKLTRKVDFKKIIEEKQQTKQ